jgi:hypothetical protein
VVAADADGCESGRLAGQRHAVDLDHHARLLIGRDSVKSTVATPCCGALTPVVAEAKSWKGLWPAKAFVKYATFSGDRTTPVAKSSRPLTATWITATPGMVADAWVPVIVGLFRGIAAPGFDQVGASSDTCSTLVPASLSGPSSTW